MSIYGKTGKCALFRGKIDAIIYNEVKCGMKDIPVFTTEYGVASLILKEIPYRREAYIRVQDVQPGQLDAMLKECASFCRMAGAEHVFAAGHDGLERYPLHTAVFEMRGTAAVYPELLESLFPVTEETVSRWRGIYNEKMRFIDNAGTLTAHDEKTIVSSGGAYFVHQKGELLGIGWMDDTKLLAVASVKPGAGFRVVNTLMSLIEGAQMTLEVASTNGRAIRLYEKMGLIKVRELSCWYRVK